MSTNECLVEEECLVDYESSNDYWSFLKEEAKRRRARREPGRMDWTRQQLEDMGYAVTHDPAQRVLMFEYKNSTIRLWPYTGWFSGRPIVDGRGFENLVKQLR